MLHDSIKLLTLVGPTASGKTQLALNLAKAFDGEIVCADSRTIYRGMDIGTAKPTAEERAFVPHHLLDVIDPGERLSAAVFKDLAEAAIADIADRGRLPIMVGGSGLYIDAVLFDYQFPTEADSQRRAELEAMDEVSLRELLAALDRVAFENVDLANRRRVIRAIETAGQQRSRSKRVRLQTLVLGLELNKEIAQNRIRQRIEKMLEEGFFEEVKKIGETYGWESEAFNIIGYRAFKGAVLGTKTIDEAKADFARGDMMLFKKQLTWFKRNPDIVWLERETAPARAEQLVREFVERS